MTVAGPDRPDVRIVLAQDVLREGRCKNISFTPEQANAIALATTSLLESAVRLRRSLGRNDEPAFGFRVPHQDAPTK